MSTRLRSERRPRPRSQQRGQVAASIVTEAPRAKRVMVATDGSRVANAAIRFATLMAERGTWTPEALTVFEPLPVSVADITLGPPGLTYQQAVTDSLLERIRRQVRRYGGRAWNILTEFGRSAPSIVRVAREHGAEIVVLGLGRHGKLARWIGAETAARVARHSAVPVLAVEARTRQLPRTALVAIDFGESSVRAAHEARELLSSGGRLHLLHVRWAMNDRTGRDTEWERTYDLGVERGFNRLVAELRGDDRVVITTELRMGGVIDMTLKVASEIDADVIALGSHNQNLVDRMVIGFTPAAILRGARCSVLIASPVNHGD
jgi:nucleotide-binding universal stress UspA family protein